MADLVTHGKAPLPTHSGSAAYAVGDVVTGRFSCQLDDEREPLTAIVRGRVADAKDGRPGWHGDMVVYEPGKGWGAWGYDDEIASVRPGTPEDDERARFVRARVEGDTDRMLRGH